MSDNVTVKAVGHSAKFSWSESAKMSRGLRSVGFGLDGNYCHDRGHWKAEC